MKIIRLDNYATSSQRALLIADSAWHLDKKPIFPTEGEWHCELRLAIRIDRVGKAISQRFADRYYNAVALVNLLIPSDERLAADPYYSMLDDTLVQGPWQEITTEEWRVELNGSEEIIKIPSREYISNIICRLSANTTLKTGDIIILPQVILQYIPERDMHVKVVLKDERLIDFYVK